MDMVRMTLGSFRCALGKESPEKDEVRGPPCDRKAEWAEAGCVEWCSDSKRPLYILTADGSTKPTGPPRDGVAPPVLAAMVMDGAPTSGGNTTMAQDTKNKHA